MDISKSNEVQYIKATVFRIDNPSTPQENEVEIKSGDANHLVVMSMEIRFTSR